MNNKLKNNIIFTVIALAFISISACKQNTNQGAPNSTINSSATKASTESSTNNGKADNTGTSNSNFGEPIVYVDSDSLLNKYDYYKEVKSDMESKGKRLQADMERKGRAFQGEVQAYQKNAVNLSPDQKKTTEGRLAKKQQELQIYQQTLSQQLGKEEQEINQKMYDKVQTYLKIYSSVTKHKMVLTYSKGGNLLYGDKSLDVTSEVVKGLNEAYSKEKAN